MRCVPVFAVALCLSAVAAPARAELGAAGTRLSVAGGAPRFYMTYGHMDEAELFAPIALELRRLQVTFQPEGDSITVLHGGAKVVTWPVIHSRDDIPATPDQPFFLSLGSTLYVPVKQLSRLVPFDVSWDSRSNTVVVVAGMARPAVAATKPAPNTTRPTTSGTKTAPVAVVRRPAPGAPAQTAGVATLIGVTVSVEGGQVKVTVQASQAVEHTDLTLKSPARIVVDFPKARWASGLASPAVSGPVRSARLGHPVADQARLVLEVTSPAVKLAGVELNAPNAAPVATADADPVTPAPAATPVEPPATRNEKLLAALRRRSSSTSGKGFTVALQSRGGNPLLGTGTSDPAPDSSAGLPLDNAWQYIIIHHSASPSGNAAAFDALHRAKGWDGLAYHFVITNGKGGGDGDLQVSPRWTTQKHGAHAGALKGKVPADVRNGFNEFGIGICLVGNFEKSAPTEAQLRTLADLVQELRTEFNIPAENVLGHGTVKGTACPGSSFPWKRLFELMGLPAPQHLHRHPANLTTARCPWCQEQAPQK